MRSEENVKLCFLVTFNIIIICIFPENFIEIQVSQGILIFTSSILINFRQFFYFLPLLATKKLSVSIR